MAIMAAASFCFVNSQPVQAADPTHDHSMAHAESWAAIKQAVAIMHPTANNKAHGRVTFVQQGDSVKVTADLEGLSPGQKHAIHIHQYRRLFRARRRERGRSLQPGKSSPRPPGIGESARGRPRQFAGR